MNSAFARILGIVLVVLGFWVATNGVVARFWFVGLGDALLYVGLGLAGLGVLWHLFFTTTVTRLVARASFHGKVVEEQFVRTGRPLEIGREPSLPVPLPEGAEYIARVLWMSPTTCAVKDLDGAVHHTEPGRPVTLRVGDVELRLEVVEGTFVPRMGALSLAGSLAWFTVVLMSALVTVQVAWFLERRCDFAFALLLGQPDVGEPLLWVAAPLGGAVIALVALLLAERPRAALFTLALPVVALVLPIVYHFSGAVWKSGDQFVAEELPECVTAAADGGGGGAFTAEYLARLLRNDLEGEEQGVIEREIDRPDAERDLQDRQIFMPAGSEGPVTRMGGAEQVAPDPVRTVVEEELAAPAQQRPSEHDAQARTGTPVEQARAEDDARDGVADGLEIDPTEDPGEAVEPPAEEHEGWGFPEWYDERDRAMDDVEIARTLRAAQHRLMIDPDDPLALSVLSYYQYLAQDYEAAKKTYDRYIELYPDDAAGYNNKALVYKRMSEYQKEEALYRVALSLEPNDETAMNNLAVNLAHQKRFDEALAVMKELETIDPEDPYADLHRSKIYAEMKKDDEALVFLEKALEGMDKLDTLHHIEFRQDIRLDPSFEDLRDTYRFRAILNKFYGKDSPLEE